MFFLDHHHAFSNNSSKMNSDEAGFDLIQTESVIGPSTKYAI
jgi:hypothetical protein